ncbi:DoxX family protein [Mucilaginibacter sp. SP1R1]|uniref:DoxX family protein n=1 Tax=Mucilaginibacter sp. SP1R1 TaxID=2723091 RepID=UPI0016090122|nr:DoxX family protein [Mucilaginibacter sp. SP1R1]MBB6150947.1 putative membrane protein [Mucilaginibacter sp. SP1R1]
MRFIKNTSLIILIAGYALAGLNHFINPASYYRIIPHYLPHPVLLNILAGGFEILFALLLIPVKTRCWAVYGIILMLIAFLPVHISMIADAPLKLGNLIVTPLIAWLRLALQPVLMLWAWWHRKPNIR